MGCSAETHPRLSKGASKDSANLRGQSEQDLGFRFLFSACKTFDGTVIGDGGVQEGSQRIPTSPENVCSETRGSLGMMFQSRVRTE